MNRRLLDPFQSVELPEIIEDYLEHGNAICMAFNRRGTLLASGTREGQVVLWDFDTRGVAAVLQGHEGAVTSVSWSRNGRLLLSGSEDQHVILWNVEDGTQVCRVPMGAPVCRVSLSPRPPNLGVVSLPDGPPVLVDLAQGTKEPLPTANDGSESAPARGGSLGGLPTASMVGVFARGGEWVLVGQPRGSITVVDTGRRRILDIIRVPNCSRVTDLVLNRKGTLLLAPCQDQRVRMYDVVGAAGGAEAGAGAGVKAEEEPPSEAQLAEALASKAIKSGSVLHGDAGLLRPLREFQNAVERTPWRSAIFSCDSEHVVGATAAKAQLQLYIWNRPLGNMERMLEGPKEGLLDITWHPLRSLLLSCSTSGRIYIWAKVHAENWSAFAPDFKELDENAEYVEREDEFDWNTPGAAADAAAAASPGGASAAAADGSALELDILTRDPEQAFSSDDEETTREELLYLPVVVEPEVLRAEGDEDDEDGEGDEDDPYAHPTAGGALRPPAGVLGRGLAAGGGGGGAAGAGGYAGYGSNGVAGGGHLQGAWESLGAGRVAAEQRGGAGLEGLDGMDAEGAGPDEEAGGDEDMPDAGDDDGANGPAGARKRKVMFDVTRTARYMGMGS